MYNRSRSSSSDWPNVSRHKYEIVRKVKDSQDISEIIDILLEPNTWNRTDPSGRMKKDPNEVLDFLEELRFGRSQAYKDMHPTIQNLFNIIVDSWLRSVYVA